MLGTRASSLPFSHSHLIHGSRFLYLPPVLTSVAFRASSPAATRLDDMLANTSKVEADEDPIAVGQDNVVGQTATMSRHLGPQ